MADPLVRSRPPGRLVLCWMRIPTVVLFTLPKRASSMLAARHEREFEKILTYIEEDLWLPIITGGRAWHGRPGGRPRTGGSALQSPSAQ